MIQNLQKLIKKNTEILALFLLVIISVISTTYFNYSKERVINNFITSINNVYFKKTINHFFDKLEPRFKKHSHKVQEGETFNSVLNLYDIKKNEISIITKKIGKKILDNIYYEISKILKYEY